MRDLTIRAVMNGYIVTAGCQTLVFGTRQELVRELDRYLADPAAVEKEFIRKYGMRFAAMPPGYADTPTPPRPCNEPPLYAGESAQTPGCADIQGVTTSAGGVGRL